MCHSLNWGGGGFWKNFGGGAPGLLIKRSRMLDMFDMSSQGRLEELKIAIVGDIFAIQVWHALAYKPERR